MLTLSLLLWTLLRDKILICQSRRAQASVSDPGNRPGVSSANPTTANAQLSDTTNNRRRRSSSKTHSRRSARRIQPDRRRAERYYQHWSNKVWLKRWWVMLYYCYYYYYYYYWIELLLWLCSLLLGLGCFLHTEQHKHRINAHNINIHSLSGIRTHDPSVRKS
jgi:hypothetical protein